ncbi:hypothetical protein SAMN05428949_4512 [Chitinophaga sp. YR627]|uniref:hypothetical protein n=1 Tax=Chitinophaga sp. YR627 TaxID=1881041 RepID=UPI0008F377F5|nr:hypothetical protein [Chitinophaga sp. YR627]SFO21868.1 hypothetical protein SAMN05428949_4512 [Chitinophaga sp. YR627]
MFKHFILLLTCTAGMVACQSPAPKFTPNPQKRAFIRNEIDNAYRRNWLTYRLQGQVKSIAQFTYSTAAADTTAPGYETKEYLSFDSTGKLAERIVYDKGIFSTKALHKYNAAGKLTEILYYGSDGKFSFRTYNGYDAEGNLIEEGQRNKDSSTPKQVFSIFDRYGGLVSQSSGDKIVEYLNTYDNDSVLVEQDGLVDKVPAGKITWKFDSIGHMIEQTQYAVNGALLYQKKTDFNQQGLPVLLSIKRQGKEENIQQLAYDSSGSLIRQATINPANGALSNATWTSYEYDAAGNWTKATVHGAGDAITGVIIRKIAYY